MQNNNKTNIAEIISLVFKGITLAMGVAVVVLNLLGMLDTNTGITLLGLGVFSAGVALLNNKSVSSQA